MWREMSWNKLNYSNKNRLIVEEYDEKQDKEFNEKYGLDINEEFLDWEE